MDRTIGRWSSLLCGSIGEDASLSLEVCLRGFCLVPGLFLLWSEHLNPVIPACHDVLLHRMPRNKRSRCLLSLDCNLLNFLSLAFVTARSCVSCHLCFSRFHSLSCYNKQVDTFISSEKCWIAIVSSSPPAHSLSRAPPAHRGLWATFLHVSVPTFSVTSSSALSSVSRPLHKLYWQTPHHVYTVSLRPCKIICLFLM